MVVDIWNGYEISWLNSKGKPVIAFAEFRFPCSSSYIIESKSFKLYLNSLNQSKFDSFSSVKETLESDLSRAVESPVTVSLFPLSKLPNIDLFQFQGTSLDNLDIEISEYRPIPISSLPLRRKWKKFSTATSSNPIA